jgi:PAS domain S-box-containing protein
MPLTLEKKIAGGFAAAIALILALGGAAWWSALRSADTFRQVDHTHEVLYQLEAVLVDMLNMQTATRGYLLTNQDRFLAPYDDGSARIADNFHRLRELTRDNPAQQKHLHQLEAAMERLLAIMRQRIALNRAGDHAAARTVTDLEAGNTVIAEVRRIIGDMERIERALLAERSAAAQAGQRRALLVFGLGSALGAGLVILAGLLVRRDFYHRLRAEEERDRFFSLSLDLLCIAHAADGRFKRVSPAVTDLLGWTPEEFLARPYMEHIHPDDRAASQAEVERQVLRGEKVLHFENRFQHKDGSWRILSWRSVPQPGGLMYAIARDVTEQKRLDAQLRQLNTELQQRASLLEAANQELESFSYSVSHDLRAPLRHIDGFAGLLQKSSGAALDEKGRRYLATISASARQMGRLIDDLLAFSRMSRTHLQPVEVDSDALVAAVIRDGTYGRDHRPIEWIIAPLPRVHADPAMLRQVWFNLIDNAVKYSGKVAAPRIEIGSHHDAAAGEHLFHVRDNGAGFDMRYAGKLFGVFQRLHGPGEFEGTGIGLANVRRIILRHGGRTWAEGAVGQGATFWFSLPARPPASTP